METFPQVNETDYMTNDHSSTISNAFHFWASWVLIALIVDLILKIDSDLSTALLSQVKIE